MTFPIPISIHSTGNLDGLMQMKGSPARDMREIAQGLPSGQLPRNVQMYARIQRVLGTPQIKLNTASCFRRVSTQVRPFYIPRYAGGRLRRRRPWQRRPVERRIMSRRCARRSQRVCAGARRPPMPSSARGPLTRPWTALDRPCSRARCPTGTV